MPTPDRLQASYDSMRYPLLTFRQASPNRLATIGYLLGLEPAPVDNCRMLDLGCASGAHIIPLAEYWPNSHFVGVDFSTAQIEEGQQFITDLGLTNIELLQADVRELPADIGQFDYIVAHGLFSWVPDDVRDPILATVKRLLKPTGVAYVSYNTYPGWHTLMAARKMMKYHIAGIEDPAEQVDAGLAFMDFLGKGAVTDAPAFHAYMRAFQEVLAQHEKYSGQRESSSIYHDELEAYNQPFYFHEFMRMAQAHGLTYLAEAEFAQVLLSAYTPEVRQRLMELGAESVIEMEQYMDFLRNRTFRQTLLVHDDAPINRRLSLRPVVVHLNAVGITHPHPDTPPDAMPEAFVGGENIVFRTDHPVTIAALMHLNKVSPQAVNFSDLMDGACAILGIEEAEADDAEAVALNLLRAYTYSSQLMEFEVTPSPFVNTISEKPQVSKTARYFADLTPRVANARHERVELDVVARVLIRFVDGTRTRNDLVDELLNLLNQDLMSVNDDDGNPIEDPLKVVQMLEQQVNLTLQFFQRAALLVG